jgi:hypothetical protein
MFVSIHIFLTKIWKTTYILFKKLMMQVNQNKMVRKCVNNNVSATNDT